MNEQNQNVKNNEYARGSTVPILEHSSNGMPCTSLEGEVTELDYSGKPMAANCVKCFKSVTINYRQLEANRRQSGSIKS